MTATSPIEVTGTLRDAPIDLLGTAADWAAYSAAVTRYAVERVEGRLAAVTWLPIASAAAGFAAAGLTVFGWAVFL